uniref:Peptidase S1 domain-containing protein n=1 Tax=Pelusios castaneus TaxID=367368 RepID=A0A8C8S433_9SAUR
LSLPSSLLLCGCYSAVAYLSCGFRPGFDKPSSSPAPRIIGGQKSRPGEWPWIVSLQSHGQHFCGGSIIHAWWVLSAAHCFHNIRPQAVMVVAGSVTLGVGGVTRRVRQILAHPSYSRTTYDSDIALLQLSQPLVPGRDLSRVCLPEDSDSGDDGQWHSCYVAGWGTTKYGQEQVSVALREAGVLIVDWLRCMWWMGALTHNMVCAGYEEGGRDACQGDSGGPLQCQAPQSSSWYQVGIVSWGRGCGSRRRPGVYTRIANYRAWIDKTMATAGRPQEAPPTALGPTPEKTELEVAGGVGYRVAPGQPLSIALGLVLGWWLG